MYLEENENQSMELFKEYMRELLREEKLNMQIESFGGLLFLGFYILLT